MGYKTQYSRAHGLGAAHEGPHHFWVQRVTAIALVPLAIFFVFPFAHALGGGYESARAVFQNGWNAFVAINFLVIAFLHLKLGLQVIIEDYVSNPRRKLRLLIANIIFTWTFAAAGVFAVLKIALSA